MLTSLLDSSERKRVLASEFKKAYNAEPALWSRAPGRVDLMGSHTDYNMGYVMTMTTDRDTWIVARPREDGMVRVRSLNIAGESCFSLDDIQHDEETPWSNYLRGMAHVLTLAGYGLTGFDGLIHSTVPFGSGLSSSAALEMATAVTFRQASGFQIDPVEMALLGQKAENEFVGVKTGILDQYSSAMGKAGCALQLDCRELASQTMNMAADLRVVICDTRAERNLVGSEYDDRRAECDEGVFVVRQRNPAIDSLRDVSSDLLAASEAKMRPVVYKRCRFIIEENQRVLDLGPALATGERSTLSALFAASYIGARDLYEIGAPSMEAMMQAMLSAPGVVAARQAGAGFGGCMVALVEDGEVADFRRHVARNYTDATGIQPRTFPVKASTGAGAL